jgi:hypothetical protein
MADPTNTEILSEAAKEPTIVDIPVIPADTPTPLRRVLESLREYVQIISGRRGNDLDTAVTFRDLVKSGIATVDLTQSARNGAVPVSLTSEAEIDYSTPPAPTALTASGGFEQIFLGWNGAGFASYSFTEIWRASANDLSQAVLVGTSVAALYVDSVPSNATRYYWVRFISKASVKGPFNSTTGTSATSAINTQYVLSTLTNQITETQLFSTLGARINLIDAPFSTAGSVDAKVKALQDSTTQSINSLQSQVNEIINIPAYSATETYQVNDQVTYNGSLYKATQTTTGNLPTNTTYWTLIGNYTSLGDAVAAHTTQINSLNNGLATEISDRTILYNQVNNATTGLPATRTMLIDNYYTKTAADLAISGQLTSYVTSTSLSTQLGNYTNTALLEQGYYSKSGTDNAISQQLTNYVSTTVLTGTLNNYATTANLTTNYATKTDVNQAKSDVTTTLTSAYQAADTTTLNAAQTYTQGYAYAKSQTYTKSDVDSAVSSTSTTLTSAYQAADTTALNSAKSYTEGYAYAKSETYTRSEANGQISSATSTLATTSALNTAISNVTTSVATKSANFVQNTTPTATKTNDLWIDTGNNNALKRWDGSNWVAAEDTRIGATATSVSTLQSSIDATTSYRIDAWGFSSPKTTFGVYNAAGARLHTPTTGWSVLVLNRSTAAVVSHTSYNTYTNSGSPSPTTAMANALNALGDDRVVVCYTYDEPRTNVFNNSTLITALERCGATSAAIANIKNRGAYILVGIPSRGAGTGYEKYAGAFSSDPAAWVTYTLQLVKGEPVGLGNTGTIALEVRADTQASSITGLQGQYTVKIDNNGHVSGFGLGSVANNGTPESAFIVRADKFALASPSDTSNPLGTTSPTTNLPFIVTTTTTYAPNGDAIPAGVYIDSAYIKKGSIETAQIKDLTANKITSGYTSAAIGFNGAKVYGAELYSGGSVTTSTDANGNITGFTPVNPTFKVVGGIVDIVADAFRVRSSTGASGFTTPFQVVDGTTYISNAVIKDGDITATKIDTRGLSIKDTAGNVILSAGASLANSTLNLPATIGGNIPAGWLNSNVSLSTLGYTGATNATRNAVSYGATTPSSPVAGDIWIRTDLNPVKVGVYNGSAWVDAGNVTTNTNQLTDGASLGSTAVWASVSGPNRPADNSTRNAVNYGATTPSSPVAGDIWIRNDLTPVKVSLYNGSAWVDAGNVTTNTNQLTDGANLGQTAAWGSVSSRPANLSGLAGTENIQNSLITISGGAIQGIGTGNNTAVANSSIAISGTNGTITMTGGPTGSVTGVVMPGFQITATNVGTYLASAAIGEGYIGNLSAGKITTGTLSAALIAANSIDATKIDSRGLSIKDSSGNVILAAGTALNWSNVTGQPSGIYNSNITLSESSGTVSLNNAGSGSFVTVTANNKITSSNISTYISNLAVDTLQIAGEAVIIPRSETGACGGGNVVFMTVTGCVANRPIILMASFTNGTGYSETSIYNCRLHRWNADITYETYNGHAAAFPRYAYPPESSPTFIDAFVAGAAIVARYIPPSDGTYYFYINSDWPCTGTIVAIHCKR